MQITEKNYDLPFKSSFDWRIALFNKLNDLATESVLDLVKVYKKNDSDVEWKDDDGLVNFALEEKLFEKMHLLMVKKAHELCI